MLALLIPIIVHLFNFRKAKKVSFSNVRFLENIKKQTSSNLKLKHFLILLSRLAFVFFLVLTFTQPFIPSTENGFQNRHVALFVDNSNSMSTLTSQDISAFNESLALAEQIVSLYPDETKFSLITNDFQASSNNQKSKAKVLEQITGLNFSALSKSGSNVFKKLINASVETKDIFILSDFQASTLGQINPFNDSINEYYIIPFGQEDQKNLFVDTVFLTNPFLIPSQPNSIQVKVRNYGSEDVNDLNIKFFINDQLSGTASIDIDKESSKTLQFQITTSIEADNKCKISFEDFPISFDNEFFFVLGQVEKIKIVEIKNDANSTSIAKVYEDNELFDFKSFQQGSIEYQVMEEADLLVINSVNQIANSLISQGESMLKKGKSVFIIPSNESFSIGGLNINNNNDSSRIALNTPDLSNPFFINIFEKLTSATQMPMASKTFEWRTNETKILTTKTGESFLSKATSYGNLYLAASPFNKQYTDFHKHALFVPVMHRIAELSSKSTKPLAFSTDALNMVIKVDSIPENLLYKLRQGDQELIPSQKISTNQWIVDIPRHLILTGFYDLQINDTNVDMLAFNHAKKESEIRALPTDELREKLSGIEKLNVLEEINVESFTQEMKDKYHSRELWKYALILSLLFLLTESALLRFL